MATGLSDGLAGQGERVALHAPAELDDWEPGFDEEGHQVSSAAITARRDAFLRAALDRLERE